MVLFWFYDRQQNEHSIVRFIVLRYLPYLASLNQWLWSQVESGGDKYWEDWRGGVWGGSLPFLVGGSGGLPPEKKICTKNYAILSKFWYLFPILQQKVGGLSPQCWKWGPIPLSPPLLWRLCTECTICTCCCPVWALAHRHRVGCGSKEYTRPFPGQVL